MFDEQNDKDRLVLCLTGYVLRLGWYSVLRVESVSLLPDWVRIGLLLLGGYGLWVLVAVFIFS